MHLEVKNLSINFGGLKAVEDVNFSIEQGEIVGLIGPNGAGKTTVFNMLTGVYTPTEGTVSLENRPLNGLKTYQIAKLGVSRTFQNIRLFSDMTALDNVKNSMNKYVKYNIFQGIFRTPAYWRSEARLDRRARIFLKFLGLSDQADSLAKNLPYGQQRRLEIARALASHPKVLLLDEPAAGMNPTETAELSDIIKKIRDKFNISILLIEHDMSFVMDICEKIVVLDYGRIIATGAPDEIKNNPKVIAAYLGEEA